jgi:hypothetical protein
MMVLPGEAPPPPTAQALRAEVAATAYSSVSPTGVGLGTRAQAVPSQCRMSVLPLFTAPPTAQALRAEVAATPKSCPPGTGTARSGTPVPAMAEPAAGPMAAAVATASSPAATTTLIRVNPIADSLRTDPAISEPDPPFQIRRQRHPAG